MARRELPFDLIEYLAETGQDQNYGNNHHHDEDRIPSLNELSKDNNISVATLREQLGVARALGLVEVRPKTGIRRLDYAFSPAINESLAYAIALDRNYFDQYALLRNQIEIAFWFDAVKALGPEDKEKLNQLIEQAFNKLHSDPIRLPHKEHRDLHLTIFSRLDNVFVLGVLEAYWDAYEDVGLARYEGLNYLEQVWDYHRRMVEAINADDFELSHRLLIEHMELINKRPD